MRRRLSTGFLLTLLAGLTLMAACRLYNLERNLNPVNADFLNKVRYIITSEERKTFLELPDSEKPQFIEDFWKRRDPDPTTEENEFKMEYFNRIEHATEAFIGEGLPGWLTDRGRIYILFGPPTDRITQPMGADAYSRCQEIWYYGNFPVVFIDQTCTGNYKLVTYELSELRDLNLLYMHELNMAQADAQKGSLIEEKKLFDFSASARVTVREAGRLEGTVTLEIPYERIWYKSEGKKLWTTLEVVLVLQDAKKATVWQYKNTYDISLDEAELVERTGKKYVVEIPVAIQDEEKLARLAQGKAVVHITLINKTGNEILRKAIDFR